MFRCSSIILLAALIVWPATTALSQKVPLADAWNGAEIEWRDIRSGIYEASQTGKTVIMVFHAPWCSACKKYREVFRDPGVVAASKNFVMILIDADADKYANGAFSPDGTYVPRTIFYNSEGDVLTSYVGKDPEHPHTIDIESPDELRRLMQRAARDQGRDGEAPRQPGGESDT